MVFLLRLAAFLACALYMANNVELGRALEALLSVRPQWVGLAMGGIGVSAFFNGARVRVLSGYRLSVLTGANSTVLALAGNIMLPGRLGEVAKIGALRLAGLPLGDTLRVIFLERLVDLNLSASLVLVLLGIHLPSRWPLFLAPLALSWAVLLLFLLHPDFLAGLLRDLGQRLPWPRFKAWLDRALGALFCNTTGRQLAGLTAYSLLALAAYLLANGLVIRYACGIDLPWLSIFSATCAGMLSLAIPATPAGLGVYEAGMVWVLGLYGVNAERALVAALVTHAIQVLPILPWAGLITLFGKGRQAPANT
ncbi:MAG: lysylphosphatidylglycerol synthase transmembrane domain-containing protein [Humidesulfovibrio sp.]|nr:lysylphosphatidylglycerol synthase transmembrane domain-containing protein [Humidesulfovibrio sp.]